MRIKKNDIVRMKKHLFGLLGFVLSFTSAAIAQNDAQNLNSFSSLPSGIPIYVDQVGMQIMATSVGLNQNTGKANPETYVLSPQDIISFQFEGNFSLLVKAAVINAQGDITIPQVGIISLAGQTLQEAHQTLKKVAKERFIKTDVRFLTLEHARNVSVQVVGNISKSQTYTIPGLTHLSVVIDQIIRAQEVEATKEAVESTNNASDFSLFSDKSQLFESTLRTPKLLTEEYKVNEIVEGSFSLRDIKIKHANGVVQTIDFIRFLKVGDHSQNPVIQQGDVIEVSSQTAWSPRVSISGAVNSEGEFGFKNGETLKELIELGSGFTPLADTSYVLVFDETGNTQKIPQGNWDSFNIQKNMRVVVPRNMDRVQASVRIHGQVLIPGLFPIRDGETNLASLLELAGGFHQDALLKGVYILRKNTTPVGNSEQSELDVLLKRTSDQYAQGLKYLDIELGIGQNRVYVDASNAELVQKTLLQDGDQIFVPRDRNSVVVFGQVNKPGVYTYNKESKVDYYLEQSGGIALAGVKERIFIIKAGSKNWEKPENTTIESGDMIFVDRKPYEDFVTSQQLEISKTQVTLSTWSLVISAISTTALLISVITR